MEGVEICTSPCSIGDNNGRLPCEQRSRAARRRRMEIRRFKLVGTSKDVSSVDLSRKKHKIAGSDSARDCDDVPDSLPSEAAGSVDASGATKVNTDLSASCSSLIRKEEKSGKDTERRERGSVGAEDRAALLTRLKMCDWYGCKSVCGRRKEMEDAVSVQAEFVSAKRTRTHFFGVYDGHGGSEAANFCKDRLHNVLAEEVEQREAICSETQWREALKESFSRVDTEVLSGGFMCGNNCQGGDVSNCLCNRVIASEAVGTTAVVAIVDPKHIIVANCGDSRAVLSRGGRPMPLSKDHKPDREDEMARIEAAGGHVIFWDGPRVSGVLAMSRAIGDKYLKPYVISEPEVSITARSDEDECLILASDGLWDVLSNEVVCEVARRCLAGRVQWSSPAFLGFPSNPVNAKDDALSALPSPSSTAAALLTQLALAKGSQDNISVVVVDLKRQPTLK